jgi:hypothetical protein
MQFVSAFATLPAAVAYLISCRVLSKFESDLVNSPRGLSDKQAAWVHKLATDRQVRQAPAASPAVDYQPIIALLHRAAAAAKRAPKITLTDTDGRTLVASLCGESSRTPGAVRLTNGAPYGSPIGRFYGTIGCDGVLAARGTLTEVRHLLDALAADPARVASQHGVRTGCCAFCGRALSTKESCSVGYGPDCAEKWGLPWGAVSTTIEAAHVVASAPIAAPATPVAGDDDPDWVTGGAATKHGDDCPSCSGEGVALGMLGSTLWLRCRACGTEWVG